MADVATVSVEPIEFIDLGAQRRRIGWMSHDGERLGPDLVCPRSGRRYREAGADRIEEIL